MLTKPFSTKNSMRYGLQNNTIQKINETLAGYKEIDEAIVYGSRAKGNFRPGSDIDLTLKGQALDLKILNKISLDLDNLLLPYTFDVSIYHQITNLDLISHIERVGKVFYKKNEDERIQESNHFPFSQTTVPL